MPASCSRPTVRLSESIPSGYASVRNVQVQDAVDVAGAEPQEPVRPAGHRQVLRLHAVGVGVGRQAAGAREAAERGVQVRGRRNDQRRPGAFQARAGRVLARQGQLGRLAPPTPTAVGLEAGRHEAHAGRRVPPAAQARANVLGYRGGQPGQDDVRWPGTRHRLDVPRHPPGARLDAVDEARVGAREADGQPVAVQRRRGGFMPLAVDLDGGEPWSRLLGQARAAGGLVADRPPDGIRTEHRPEAVVLEDDVSPGTRG